MKSKLETLKQLLPWKHLQSLLGYKTVADQKTFTPRVGRHFLYETVSNPSMEHIANYREMSQNFIAKNIPEETLIYIYYFDHDVNEKSPFTCWWVTVVNSYGGYGVYSYGNSCQSPRVSKDTRFLRTQNRMWLRFQKNDNMTYIFNYKLILTKLSLYLYGFQSYFVADLRSTRKLILHYIEDHPTSGSRYFGSRKAFNMAESLRYK